eukprot:TRINITY_DN6332_c0_g2_i1.p1 TRINITY_DN6332_c0_g2~~TRINITY_DN6332_c0_g2_i1.p1  ORF type:complete len:919 (-),score=211.60 TRINITY_DN6332_c0_g2_i1:100-2856(-)
MSDRVEEDEMPIAANTQSDDEGGVDEMDVERDMASLPQGERNRVVEEEEEGEDLIDDEKMMDDYRAIPELDRYDSSQIDSADYEDIDVDARRAAEIEIERRERKRGRPGRDLEDYNQLQVGVTAREPAALRSEAFSDLTGIGDIAGDDGTDGGARAPQRRRIADMAISGRFIEDESVNLEDYQPPFSEWIGREGIRREIKKRFRTFLSEFTDGRGRLLYPPRISAMCSENKESLNVNFPHLSQACPVLSVWIADCPKQVLELLDEETYSVVLLMFPQYNQVHPAVHVRITDLPISDSIRDLRQEHLNSLIKVPGVVTRRTSVFPQLLSVRYTCKNCNQSIGPFFTNGSQELNPPASCVGCGKAGPFTINSQETVYRNYQKITIQEAPGSVPAGRVPRTKEVILTNDLKDVAKPGEIVEVTGIYMNSYDALLNSKHGFPVFSTIIEAVHVHKPKENLADGLTDDDIRVIRSWAQNPQIGQIIKNSIAPSIYGHDDIKMAIALTLFGGQPKVQPSLHRIRGDINVLMLGDPGTAKSQFLKYIEKTVDRAIFTTGKGASAVGLTASVHRDPMTREWTLEGGALVLADQGICLIDEFDKMNDQDRTSIHEAMEQQSISISKAGIVATLQARCSVIAAANPIKGRYDSSITFAENVELTDPILSRFDILCVVRDTIDPVLDQRLALHVVQNHMKCHPNHVQEEELDLPVPAYNDQVMPQELLRKYLRYSRQNIRPQLTEFDSNRITELYVELREQSARTGGIPITVRHIESLVRMAEAHAKMHLRPVVNQSDVDMAIRVMLQSFIETQKFQVMNVMRKRFKRFITYKRDNHELLFFLLKGLVSEVAHARAYQTADHQSASSDGFENLEAPIAAQRSVEVSLQDLVERAREYDIMDLDSFYRSDIFLGNGFVVDLVNGIITHQE